MSEDSWIAFHRRWSRLKPPLRANLEVVAAMGRAIENHRRCALLLGVTPELADIAATIVAVDWSESMIAHVWPGDTGARRAVLGDWLAMPLRGRRFTAVIGDGSLNALEYAKYPALLSQLAPLLLPAARLAVRVYERPAACESLEVVRREAMAGRIAGFHAFKWRLAMAVAAESRDTDVPVAVVHRVFNREFPDRESLSRATGWSAEEIDEIDAYAGSPATYSFPTRDELVAALPPVFHNPRFAVSGSYELAERCPILIADFSA